VRGGKERSRTPSLILISSPALVTRWLTASISTERKKKRKMEKKERADLERLVDLFIVLLIERVDLLRRGKKANKNERAGSFVYHLLSSPSGKGEKRRKKEGEETSHSLGLARLLDKCALSHLVGEKKKERAGGKKGEGGVPWPLQHGLSAAISKRKDEKNCKKRKEGRGKSCSLNELFEYALGKEGGKKNRRGGTLAVTTTLVLSKSWKGGKRKMADVPSLSAVVPAALKKGRKKTTKRGGREKERKS